jgi:hypothetical protein
MSILIFAVGDIAWPQKNLRLRLCFAKIINRAAIGNGF